MTFENSFCTDIENQQKKFEKFFDERKFSLCSFAQVFVVIAIAQTKEKIPGIEELKILDTKVKDTKMAQRPKTTRLRARARTQVD